jgi:hypothetical protein
LRKCIAPLMRAYELSRRMSTGEQRSRGAGRCAEKA